MNCNQIKQHIPLWLDGELSNHEAEITNAHLKSCPTCQAEMAFWQQVRLTLKAELGDIKAPPGFANTVMTQLTGKRKTGLSNIMNSWKRNFAAAAALLILATGSIGVYLHMGGNNAKAPQVAINNTNTKQIAKEQPKFTPSPIIDTKTITNTATVQSPKTSPDQVSSIKVNDVQSQTTVEPTKNISATQIPNKQVASPPKSNNSPTISSQPKAAQPATSNTSQPAATQADNYVLLSTDQDRFVENTLVQVKVTDIDAAYKQALSMINSSGSQYEMLGTDTTPGNSQETLKVTVNSNLAGSLKGNFTKLGQVINTNTQKQDLSEQYNEKVDEYHSLETQLQAAGTADEKDALQIQMTSIEEQLKAWNQEANTDTIILWLEN